MQVERIVEVACPETDGRSVTLVVISSVSGIHIGGPGFGGCPGDEIDDTSYGIGTIDGRSRSPDNFHAFHVVHVQAGEVNIVHGFACQTFSIDQKQYGIPAEPLNVE